MREFTSEGDAPGISWFAVNQEGQDELSRRDEEHVLVFDYAEPVFILPFGGTPPFGPFIVSWSPHEVDEFVVSLAARVSTPISESTADP